MNRQEGYYWVKYYNEWRVAFWEGIYWLFIDDHKAHHDGEMDEINETQILPPNN